jgi:ATP-dependent exoDNAse (exonuclease V) beta subunit
MKFDSKSHSYIREGQKYISATQFIALFKNKFDTKKVAENYSKKHGETPEYWIEEWKKISDEACEKGTRYHYKKQMESSEEIIYNYEEDSEGVKHGGDISNLPEGEHREIILWLNSAKIAGQADKIIIKNGKLIIEDYKTNKEIKKESYKHWKTGHQMMKAPLRHIVDCNFWHYALQLNLYAYIILKHNPKLELGKLQILHVIDVEEDIVRPYIIPNLQEEIQSMIDYYKQTK